jgi:hypothetical protein
MFGFLIRAAWAKVADGVTAAVAATEERFSGCDRSAGADGKSGAKES